MGYGSTAGVKRFAIYIAAIVIAGGLFILMPPPDPLIDAYYSTVLLSKEGKLLSARIADDEQWRFPAGDRLPEKYVTALLHFEDRHFYNHPGVNPVSLIRAIYQNAKQGKIVSGGSTITMQLARMVRGNQERNLRNKISETFLALRMEIYLGKEEILRQYAAHAPFGGNVVGLEAASWRYYGRPADQLSWAESANLAVLPNAPGLVFPGTNDERLLNKRNKLLNHLHDLGYINKLDLDLSLAEELPGKPLTLPDQAPHLTERVITNDQEGSYVNTTLSYDIQLSVNDLVKEYHENIKFREVNNAAVLVTHIESGTTLAYVGNTPFEKGMDHGQQVDIIMAKRSPGSLLKPVLYALALDDGLISPDQLLPDIPLYYQGFVPQNFNKEFKGAVHASRALQSSLNVPFVNLLKYYGYEKMHSRLKTLGVKSLNRDPGHYGLTMILGGGEVTLWEMNNIYAGMARTLKRFNSSKGELRYYSGEFQSATYLKKKQKIVKPDVKRGPISAGSIWLTFKAMEELIRPGMQSNWRNYVSAKAISWKTGTSYGHKDAWSIGINSDYIVGVWVGNADGEGRPDLVGAEIAAPLMFRVFEKLDIISPRNEPGQKSGQEMIAPIANLEKKNICEISGYRAGPNCDAIVRNFLPNSLSETAICPYHKIIFMDKSERWQVNSSCYPVRDMIKKSWFILPASQSWYYRKNNHAYQEPPKFMSQCNSDNEQVMEMVYPRKWAKVYIPTEINGMEGEVVFEAAHQNPGSSIYWHLDDQYVGVTKNNHQLGMHPDKGDHTLSLLDEDGHEVVIQFEVMN